MGAWDVPWVQFWVQRVEEVEDLASVAGEEEAVTSGCWYSEAAVDGLVEVKVEGVQGLSFLVMAVAKRKQEASMSVDLP